MKRIVIAAALALSPTWAGAQSLLSSHNSHAYTCKIEADETAPFPTQGEAQIALDGDRQRIMIRMAGVVDGDGRMRPESIRIFPLVIHDEGEMFFVAWNQPPRGAADQLFNRDKGGPLFLGASVPGGWPPSFPTDSDLARYSAMFQCREANVSYVKHWFDLAAQAGVTGN